MSKRCLARAPVFFPPGLLCLVGLVLLVGCADETIPIACTGDQHCPPPSPLLSFAAQLFPRSPAVQGTTARLVIQEEPRLSFDATGAAILRFVSPARVTGIVRDESGKPVPQAQALAVLPSAFLGQSPFSFGTSTGIDGAFSLNLPVPRKPREQRYHFWVGFDDGAPGADVHPPMWFDQVISADTTLPVPLPGRSALINISGHITGSQAQGVAGMRVQVLGDNEKILSTAAVSASGADAGAYSVLVDPNLTDASHFTVVAQPGAQVQPGQATLLRVIDRPMGSTLVVDFSVPAYRPPQDAHLQISGVGTSGASQPVAGARVQAQAYLLDPALDRLQQQALYAVVGDTDSQGRVTLSLVPAQDKEMLTYTVLVTSPASSPFASSVLPLSVSAKPGDAPLVLPLRTQVSGRILSASGMPVAGAQVLARGLDSAQRVSTQLGDVAPRAVSDSDGRFAMRLDQDAYDLDIIPVVGTEPRFSVNNLRVLTDDVELGYIRLPRPTLARLLVLDPTGYPAPSTSLRVFELAPPFSQVGSIAACDVILPCPGMARLRAELTTDSHGRAQFLLPDQAP